MTAFQNLKRPYQKLELAGLAAVLLSEAVSQSIKEPAWFWHPLMLLPGTVLLGAAAYLHRKLPKDQKEPVKVDIWGRISHVYFSLFVAVVLEVAALLEGLQGWNGAVDAVSAVIVILLALATCGVRSYGLWYSWTDQDKKRKRREYHRKKHGKK